MRSLQVVPGHYPRSLIGAQGVHKYHLLDGIRGVAAVSVVIYHAHDLIAGGNLFPQAYLAVDLFFMLSGFVISHAYDPRLAAGMTVRSFAAARYERLAPAYWLAITLALFGFTLAIAAGRKPSEFSLTIPNVALQILLLPVPPGHSLEQVFYPLDPAAWSIGFELVANFVFALSFAVAARARGLLPAAVCLAALVLWKTALDQGGLDAGIVWRDYQSGLARVGFAFFAGVLLRRHQARLEGLGGIPWWIVLGATCTIFLARPSKDHLAIFDLTCVVVVFPAIIAAGSQIRMNDRATTACGLLGAVSYPLYILHTPLLFLLTGVVVRLTHRPTDALRPWGGIIIVASIVAIAIAIVVERSFERPILRWLRARRKKSGRVVSTEQPRAALPDR